MQSRAASRRRRGRRGVTMIELLVVMGIIVILASLTLPSFTVVRSEALQHGGATVAHAIFVARENALAKNRQVSVRFIEGPAADGQNQIIGVQPWIVSDSNVAAPLAIPSWLPRGVVISQNASLSPLLGVASGTMNVGGVSRAYVGFNFLASGAPNTTPGNTFVTVLSLKDAAANAAPANFRSIWINPVTGEIRTFAP